MKKLVRFAVFHTKSSRITSSLKPTTFVSIGYRLGGGVVITDKSRAISENCNVLGIGVAVKVNVSTFAAIVLVCLYITVFVPHLQSIIQGL
jgi:hypothetical protein